MRLSTAAALCGGVMRRPARLTCSILCAQVLSVKELSDGSKMYYVHWSDFNRRLDSWVKPEDVDYTATKDKIKEIKARNANFDKFRHEGHDDHDGLDEASLKEHEEVTKIKNVHKIQMGKFIVETWYFSPLPREIWKQGDDIIDVRARRAPCAPRAPRLRPRGAARRSGAHRAGLGQRGSTPLHYAAENGHLEVAEKLLAAGADVSATDDVRGPLAGEGGRREFVSAAL